MQHALDLFPPEQSSLFTIVPAGAPSMHSMEGPGEADISRRRVSAPKCDGRLRQAARQHRSVVISRMTISVARALRSASHRLTIRIAPAFRSTARLPIQTARALRALVQFRIQMARALRSMARRFTIQIARGLQATARRTIEVEGVLQSSAQRLAAPALVITCGTAAAIAGIAVFRQMPSLPSVQTPAATPSAPSTVQPSVPVKVDTVLLTAQAIATVTAQPVGAISAVAERRPREVVRVASNNDKESSPSETKTPPGPAAHGRQPVADTRAIQRVLNKYRDAFSILDVRAVRAVWPAADTRALGMAFDRLEEQNLEFDSCRISVTDLRAEASCRGSAQYTQVAGPDPRTEPRQWQFALHKVDEKWLIDAVKSR